MPQDPLTSFDFSEQFARHESAFRLYARSLLPTWDAVDEVIQSASLIMWRKLDQLELPDGFRPWGKCIVRFEAQKYCRTKARDVHVFDSELLDLLARHQDEQEWVSLEQEQMALEECLETVSESSRLLVLAPYQGHGFMTKIADGSGRTRNSLYKQIRRIRRKLEQCVDEKLASPLPKEE
jgi:RNA polymerase sigma-70 factor, ECF subfamily